MTSAESAKARTPVELVDGLRDAAGIPRGTAVTRSDHGLRLDGIDYLIRWGRSGDATGWIVHLEDRGGEERWVAASGAHHRFGDAEADARRIHIEVAQAELDRGLDR
ncbi:hypothetical protein [Nocardia wallacei]|uniref:hypothetical protein n=1 Tax=Nocardia wallacei TaxID=480035 RepID=UPI0024563C71|nr:hypothetical protein [Nocardia wallacei]